MRVHAVPGQEHDGKGARRCDARRYSILLRAPASPSRLPPPLARPRPLVSIPSSQGFPGISARRGAAGCGSPQLRWYAAGEGGGAWAADARSSGDHGGGRCIRSGEVPLTAPIVEPLRAVSSETFSHGFVLRHSTRSHCVRCASSCGCALPALSTKLETCFCLTARPPNSTRFAPLASLPISASDGLKGPFSRLYQVDMLDLRRIIHPSSWLERGGGLALSQFRGAQALSFCKVDGLVYSSLIGFTSCIVESLRFRSSFFSSPLWTPEVYGPDFISSIKILSQEEPCNLEQGNNMSTGEL